MPATASASSAAPDLHPDLAWLRREPVPPRVGARTRPRPGRRRSALWLSLALGAAAIAGLLLPARQDGSGPAGARAVADRPPPEAQAPPPSWQPLPQALPLYALEAPEGVGPRAQAARQHAGGGREDTLALGGPGAPLQFRLSVTRGVAEGPGAGPSFYVALVRRAAEAGLPVERSTPPAPLATKFGTAEAAPATLGGLACLSLRFRHPDLAFRLHGWLCGSEALAVDETHLACLVDGLVLAGGGEDPAMKVLFTQAEAWRTGACALARWGGAAG